MQYCSWSTTIRRSGPSPRTSCRRSTRSTPRSPATRRRSTAPQLQRHRAPPKTVRVRSARRSSPTARSPRRRSASAATTSSRPTRSRKRQRSRRRSRLRGSAARSRCAKSWRCSDAVHAADLRRRVGVAWARGERGRDRRAVQAAHRRPARARHAAARRRAEADRDRNLVRVRDDETLITDGPFAETKEQLGGFYIIEVDSLDEAIEWAARIPDARHGTIEVRPRRRPLGERRIDELTRAYREERGRCLAILARVLGDLELAEDAVQEAFATARRTLAARRRAGQPRRLDRRDRAQPRDRPDPPRADARPQDASCSRAPSAIARRRGRRDPGRAARADLRVLPSGARDRGAGRADAAASSAA